MTETSLAVRQSNVLERIGSPQERQYLIQIMAEQIGIPAADATRTDVVALLASAAQRGIQYGWVPGVHMHVQKFESERSKNARKADPSKRAVYTYTLVDGEKAWKDSGTRWRERGVNWRYQRKAMTRAEVEEEARLQGYNQPLANNAFGMWSRILIIGQDDPNNADDPLWSAGLYFGKIKTGNFWRDDTIPTGISTRDIAIRRADKRAMMQSQLTLLPVDDLSADERVRRLVENLRHEAEVRDNASTPLYRPELPTEEDGEILWAQSRQATRPPAIANGVIGFDVEVVAEPLDDVDFAPEPEPEPEAGARPAEAVARSDTGARPTPPGARPINTADGPCPECRAPTGRLHATHCKIAATAEPGARPVEDVARPVEKAAEIVPLTGEDQFLLDIASIHQGVLSKNTQEVIRKIRNAEKDSAMKMSNAYYLALVAMIDGTLNLPDDDEARWILTMLVGYPVDNKARPGQLVHSALIKPLRDEDANLIAALTELHGVAANLYTAMMEGKDQDG